MAHKVTHAIEIPQDSRATPICACVDHVTLPALYESQSLPTYPISHNFSWGSGNVKAR